MKKIGLILLALLMLLLCAACDSSDSQKDSTGDTVDVSALPPDQVLTVIGEGAQPYALVRSDLVTGVQVDASILMRNALNDAFGANITLTTDWVKKGEEASIPAYEILIGTTTRPESIASLEGLGDGHYIIKVDGEKLVINGTSDYAIKTGVELFIAQYITAGTSTLKLPRDLLITGEAVIDHNNKVYNISTSVIDKFPYWHHDITRLIVCFQGLYNKNFDTSNSMLHITRDSDDTFWYNYMSGEGMFLENHEVIDITSDEDFWELFGSIIKQHGIVLWDSNVPATANVATTICGVDGYLPVRYDTSEGSLYNVLIERGVEVKYSLVDKFTGSGKISDTDIDSTGSTKNDAYLWAIEKYLDKTSKTHIAYVLDGAGCIPGNYIYETSKATQGVDAFWNAIYNHDYFVMKEMFVFDLTINDTEAPCDDPDQVVGTDAATAVKLMKAYYEYRGGELAQLIGFPPWWMKYTTHHDLGNIVATTLEWDFTEFITTYNLIKEADAAMPCCMTNASVYNNFPLQESYENVAKNAWLNNTEKEVFDENIRYFTIYMGDYDSSAWLKNKIPSFWSEDSARGTFPIAWGFNPNLSDRVPMVWDYIMRNQTEYDFLMAGDSGAGYVIPSALVNSSIRDYPSAADEWVEYCATYYKKFDLDITGFIINGNNPMEDDVFEMYNKISPVGSFHNTNTSEMRLVIYKGVPYLHMMNGISNTPEQATVDAMYKYFTRNVNFAIFRTVQQNPTDLKATIDLFLKYTENKQTKYTYKYVDPYTLFDLIMQSGQGKIIE